MENYFPNLNAEIILIRNCKVFISCLKSFTEKEEERKSINLPKLNTKK